MIPLFSAQAVNAQVALEPAVLRVLHRNHYVLGQEVAAFEEAFARYVGTPACVSVANGTDALQLALQAAGVVAGDKVACVANAGFYSSAAIRAIGAVPLYVDIDPATMGMAAASLAYALPQHPKAVVATHLYGQMADVEAIVALARETGTPVVEDCAQAHGARRGGRQAGSFGSIGCFSFYPTKNLGALGDGGAVVCHEPAAAEALRCLRQYGWTAKYHVTVPQGRNSRLDEIQAAVLSAKLPLLDIFNGMRRSIAARYNAAFKDLPLVLPGSLGEDYVAHLYVVRLDDRDRFREHLRACGVATDIHYPVPDHLQSAYRDGTAAGPLPHTEQACRTVVSLPCFPGLAEAEVAQVVDAVRSFFQ